MDTSLTLHQISPIIGAIKREHRAWLETVATCHLAGDHAGAVHAIACAEAVDRVLSAVTHVATGGARDA
jgi:hypothetical protein